jgi:hypothetical protein
VQSALELHGLVESKTVSAGQASLSPSGQPFGTEEGFFDGEEEFFDGEEGFFDGERGFFDGRVFWGRAKALATIKSSKRIKDFIAGSLEGSFCRFICWLSVWPGVRGFE